MQEKNNSNKCVNTKFEKHIYTIGNTKFIVKTFNRNENPEAILERLKRLAVNHIDTKN